jgi:hypothetical protein
VSIILIDPTIFIAVFKASKMTGMSSFSISALIIESQSSQKSFSGPKRLLYHGKIFWPTQKCVGKLR